jgi:hypothetical protein
MQAQGNEHKEDKAGILSHHCFQDTEQLGPGILGKLEEQLATSKYTNLLDQKEFVIWKFLGEESCNKRMNHM